MRWSLRNPADFGADTGIQTPIIPFVGECPIQLDDIRIFAGGSWIPTTIGYAFTSQESAPGGLLTRQTTIIWSPRQDSNLRPTASKAVTLPDCATERLYLLFPEASGKLFSAQVRRNLSFHLARPKGIEPSFSA